MQDTDASGALYFTNQLQIALEAFETYLTLKQFSLSHLITNGDFLLPIVHSEANYFSPLFLGDHVMVALKVGEIGDSSFTLNFDFIKEDVLVGTVQIIHVSVSRKTKKSISIPNSLIKIIS
ncbi:MAG: acyl-CoA thioesterase [Simkaniaceae bacterium]|nr:acyl-CoA thioesterase [Simkaniaceae bacterium]